MKTINKTEKQFDAVKFMRTVRDNISKDTEGMNFEQLKKYFEERKRKLPKH
jgi:hypothetical protein